MGQYFLLSRQNNCNSALDSQNQVKATHTVETAGAPAKIVMTIDAPNEKTGTGTRYCTSS